MHEIAFKYDGTVKRTTRVIEARLAAVGPERRQVLTVPPGKQLPLTP